MAPPGTAADALSPLGLLRTGVRRVYEGRGGRRGVRPPLFLLGARTLSLFFFLNPSGQAGCSSSAGALFTHHVVHVLEGPRAGGQPVASEVPAFLRVVVQRLLVG